ncbi:RNA polymerase sigma factor [Pseudoalteromonas sp. SSDWG2]|uniref:RNA polymerase sigma factor n=1 Tax=Pseudoalteromonas sp. SSDWG2 TaxID=3139391 RepID=UPI003BAB5B84
MPEHFYSLKIEPYLSILFKLCRAYSDNQADLDDLMQEVCLQVFISHKNFKGEASWSTWIYRVALNVCLTFNRDKKQTSQFDEIDLGEHQVSHSIEALDLLYKGLRKLQQVDRALLVMYLEGFSYEEIAAVVGGNANSLAVRVKRLKDKVAKELENND